MMSIGRIKEISRHPVKSFGGEKVEKTKVMEYGLYGDRSHAFLDESKSGKYLTITQAKDMVKYTAKFLGEETLDQYPSVQVTTPNNRQYIWGDEELTSEIKKLSKRKVIPTKYTPTDVPLGAIEEENILIVTDASIEELTRMWGNNVDNRRFRPNLLISLNEKKPFIEDSWLGKKMKIGDEVELEIKRHCERCMIITIDPEEAERDPSLLKTVVKERGNRFGVYASVIKTGDIHAGDKVFLVE